MSDGMDFAKWEGLRRDVTQLADEPRRPGQRYKLEAPDLKHTPVPWGDGIMSGETRWLLGCDDELLIVEIGYRAAWRMGAETHDGHMRRFIAELHAQCERDGHDMQPARPYARKYGWTEACPRCGHTNGEGCRCSFCKRGLRAV